MSRKEEEKSSSEEKNIVNQDEVYTPFLAKMKCRGNLQIESPNHFPKCHGISRKIEVLQYYPPMKASQALSTFKNQTSFYHSDDDENEGFGGSPRTQSKIKSHPTLAANKDSIDNYPHVVDKKWKEMKETLEEQTAVNLSKLDTTNSEMKMYGTSSAYMLMLRPQSEHDKKFVSPTEFEKAFLGQKDVTQMNLNGTDDAKAQTELTSKSSILYAVNPVNELGVAKRLVKSTEHGVACTSTTIKIGVLEIHLASLEEIREVDDTETQASKDTTSLRDKKYGTTAEGENVKIERRKPIITLPTFQETIKFVEKVDKASDKILHHMVQNATFVKNELNNDFVNRTAKASEKVVDSFEKNLVRMKKTLIETYKFFSDIGRD
ncbi:predicted protein [Chaetoceros tenuissimus]|uniref:Uncharacterized protein n=1 Tax=Chaetoceros tenuissimus TaxID=426638 RepID=A0AAD3H000_9STRA|nr:predicted protein [Chaetoceros tenuissimus]